MSNKDSKTGKKGLRTSYASTIIGISLVLFMIGLVLAALLGLGSVQRQARESLKADLFFKAGWNETDIKQLEQELKDWPYFREVTFVSPENAVLEFGGQEQNPEEILAIFDGENPMPATITFSPKEQYATKAGMKEIEEKLVAEYPEMIDEVSFDAASVEDVNLGFRQIAFLVLAVAALLIIVAVAMINNTIRLALYSKRFTIKTMQLVGATGSFIRRPFLKQAVMQGILSSIIGMALLMTLFFALNNVLYVVQIDPSWLDLVMLFAAITITGVALTVISTWFALTKNLRTKLDDLY